MKIVTFNIRCDYDQDGGNSFAFRRDGIRACIARERPDVIGFQEALPHVVQWLRENLAGYTVVGCGRDEDLSGEHMIIACRRDSLHLLGLDTLWLSPTPALPGSRYEDQSTCPRSCSCALLREEASGRIFRVYVTHLDHESAYAREEGLKLILSRMRADGGDKPLPAILLGDFNAHPGDPELAPLEASGFLRDVTAESGPTYHDYGSASEKIDYIVVSPDFECRSMKPWTDCVDGVYLSDHYPVEAVLEFRA